MLFVPINADSESALDEKNAKTLEQQQAEILRVIFWIGKQNGKSYTFL